MSAWFQERFSHMKDLGDVFHNVIATNVKLVKFILKKLYHYV